MTTFSQYGRQNCSADSRVVFLVICEGTWHQDATSGCVQNMVNTMVWLDLQFKGSLSFRCPGEDFGNHFGRLLETLGSLFIVFEGAGRGCNFD